MLKSYLKDKSDVGKIIIRRLKDAVFKKTFFPLKAHLFAEGLQILTVTSRSC